MSHSQRTVPTEAAPKGFEWVKTGDEEWTVLPTRESLAAQAEYARKRWEHMTGFTPFGGQP